jgi:phytoene dehydrogenase-like protein
VSSIPKFDVVIVGGGHNGLVAACYLGKAGLSVAIVEANSSLGGATVSQKVFPDFDAKLSRYSYLVSLLPDQIVSDLGLNFTTLSRDVASFTPESKSGVEQGLLIATKPNEATRNNFSELTGDDAEYLAWTTFYTELKELAETIAPTLLKPLPTRSELREQISPLIWDEIMEQPIGEAIENRFKSDLVRGVVLTDALIGTFSDAHSFAANRCFIYHLIGNGLGEWRVPKGGMGGLIDELVRVATSNGVQFFTSSPVTGIKTIPTGYQIEVSESAAFTCKFVLANCAPQLLAEMMGDVPTTSLDGCQVKVNMLLHKLPRLKSGVDPLLAFAGTFHFDERYSDLQLAFRQSANGEIPDRIPAEMYCHTLSDPSILSRQLQDAGYQTLTLFALHTPASLFDSNHDEVKAEIGKRLLAQLNEYLVDPIETCLAIAKDGTPCIEIKSPQEIEKEIGLPRGNIFHKDLSWPFREDDQPRSWGVETTYPNLFLCGAGAIRGGGVSGIPGHNAAAAIMEAMKG